MTEMETPSQSPYEEGPSEEGNQPRLKFYEPEPRCFMVTWVRTSEMRADVILEPGVSKESLIEALEAGMFCGGEINDPETGQPIAIVEEFDVEDIEDDGFVIE